MNNMFNRKIVKCSKCSLMLDKTTANKVEKKIDTGFSIWKQVSYYCDLHKENYQKMFIDWLGEVTYIKETRDEVDEHGNKLK